MKRPLKILAVITSVVVALVVLLFVAAVAFVDLDQLVNEQLAKSKPDLEQRLGRKLSIGKVTTRVFPTLGGRVEAVAIAADPSHQEDDRPLLQLSSVGFDVALLKAVFSFGKHIEVTHVDLDGLKLSVVRYPDGHLSYQDIVDRQATQATREPPPEKPAPDQGLSTDTQGLLGSVSIDRVRVTDAEVRLVDLQTATGKATGKATEHLIHKLNLRLDDVRLASAISIQLDAAVFSDAKNLELKASVGPLPANLHFEGLPRLGGVKLVAKDLDLSPIAPYLSGHDTGIASARFSADLEVGPVEGPQPIAVSGTMGLRGLELKAGRRFDASIETKLKAKMGPNGLDAADIDRLELKVGTVKLAVAGALADLGGTPRFKGFTMRSTTLDPGALLSYYPAAQASLPRGMRLEGMARLDVSATGDAQKQTVKADLDMTGLDVLLPDTLTKPAGTAMALKVDGDFTASDALLRQLSFGLDELDLEVSGSVKDFNAPAVDLALLAKPFSFDRLVRLLPSAKSALAEAQAKAEGDGKLSGHVRGTARSLDAALELELIGCKLDLPSAKVDGDLRLTASARGDPKKDLVAVLDFDADKAVLVVPGKVNKAATTPWSVKASVERKG